MAIFIQTCNHFLPQYNSETAGLLATKFGMALGIHLKNLPHMMRPRPSASDAALAPLQRRGGCGNFLCKHFSPHHYELTARRAGRPAEAGVGEATLQVWMPRKGHRSKTTPLSTNRTREETFGTVA